MRVVTVRGEAVRDRESRLPVCDQIEDSGAENTADHLSHDVQRHMRCGKPASGPEADGDRGIEMPAGNRAERVRSREHCQTESERYADESNADFGERRREDRATATAENEPKRTDELCG